MYLSLLFFLPLLSSFLVYFFFYFLFQLLRGAPEVCDGFFQSKRTKKKPDKKIIIQAFTISWAGAEPHAFHLSRGRPPLSCYSLINVNPNAYFYSCFFFSLSSFITLIVLYRSSYNHVVIIQGHNFFDKVFLSLFLCKNSSNIHKSLI